MKPISHISLYLYLFGYKTKEYKAWRSYWTKRFSEDRKAIAELNEYRNNTIKECEHLRSHGIKHTFEPLWTFNALINKGYTPMQAQARILLTYGNKDARAVTECS